MEFIEPSGIAVDRFGNFLVGDSKNNKIKVRPGWVFDDVDNLGIIFHISP